MIYADPPWTYRFYSGEGISGRDGLAQNIYKCMPLEDICAMSVKDLAAKDCVLMLWATMPLLQDALAVIEAWGFIYKTNGFAWIKTNRNGGLYMGMGYWTRSNPELCLLATRGQPKRISVNVEEVLMDPVGRHSAKPERAAHRIEQLVDGPYLELFARRPRRGWDVFGNQVEHDLVTKAEMA